MLRFPQRCPFTSPKGPALQQTLQRAKKATGTILTSSQEDQRIVQCSPSACPLHLTGQVSPSPPAPAVSTCLLLWTSRGMRRDRLSLLLRSLYRPGVRQEKVSVYTEGSMQADADRTVCADGSYREPHERGLGGQQGTVAGRRSPGWAARGASGEAVRPDSCLPGRKNSLLCG